MNNVEFTKEMAKDYTILVPNMCSIHFELLKSVLGEKYKIELLKNEDQSVIDEGLKNVHNDTCYPALLVIGQMISALKSGKYDTHKVALIITQTGGGCRASNYLYLLRKALDNSGFEYVPIIPLNISNIKFDSGFKLSPSMINKLIYVLFFGDLLMDLNNQTKAYEINRGESNQLLNVWLIKLDKLYKEHHFISNKLYKQTLIEIVKSFNDINLNKTNKVKVGIVGEIYVKYSSLGNNHLEDFLYHEDVEVKMPGLLGFGLYCVYNTIEDNELYGVNKIKLMLYKFAYKYLTKKEETVREIIKEYSNFEVFSGFDDIINKAKEVISLGVKMGEGWLLCGEMLDLIDTGYPNIISAQPFGCLPNHIVAKGMIKKIREIRDNTNVVAIDYDPSASRVNQENRIKLMLALAKENIENHT